MDDTKESPKSAIRRRGPQVVIDTQSKKQGDTGHKSGSGSGSAVSKEQERPEQEPIGPGTEEMKKRDTFRWKGEIPTALKWIPDNFNYAKLKPVIRCAVAAWLALVLFVIPKVQLFLGQASFLILVASVLSPPSDPFLSVLERELLIMLFASLSWAWSCLGIKLADLARTNRTTTVGLADVVHGEYIETAPTIIIGVFIFVGSFAILFTKAHQGVGPYLFPCVFACICLDISLTTAALFPFPYYKVGQIVVLPLVFHSAIALVASIIVYPSSLSAQFTSSLLNVLSPLSAAIDQHKAILTLSPLPSSDSSSSESSPYLPAAASQLSTTVAQADAALTPLAATARLLRSDLIYSRYAPADFTPFWDLTRRLAVRANGMGVYFELIEPTRERFPITPAPSAPVTPVLSRSGSPVRHSQSRPRSRAASLERGHQSQGHGDAVETGGTHVLTFEGLTMRRGRRGFSKPSTPPLSPVHSRQSSHTNLQRHLHQSHLHQSLFHHAFHGRYHRHSHDFHRQENSVGVFESQRYMNLEAKRFTDPMADVWTGEMVKALKDCASPLLEMLGTSLRTLNSFFSTLHSDRLNYLFKTQETKGRWAKQLVDHEKAREDLFNVLERFRQERRHRILDPYRSVFDEAKLESIIDAGEDDQQHQIPAHRYLFQAYVYQYHLIQFTSIVIEMMDEITRLQQLRTTQRLWTPVQRLIRWNHSHIMPDSAQRGDDEDPDTIQGISPATLEELNLPVRRDPDALPPRNWFERAMEWLYQAVTGLAGGNLLFAVKAGVLTVLLSLPSLLPSSAFFAYDNRFVWGIIMGQVTIARFQGDTTFGLIARTLSTFLGGVGGMLLWYISCGSGRGNAFGLAAVGVVSFPFLLFVRLYWPGPPMTIIIFCVTCMLVLGYSYQDVHQALPGNPGFGFDVAWRRLILVTAGVFAAFVASFFPPATTIRRYQRNVLATTSSELGAIYCAIVSFANSRREEDVPDIVLSLSALRSKLTRSTIMRTNAVYEFSLRGPWPVERYHTLFQIQLQIAYNLSHLMSVFKHLEPAWARALLRRTRFMDTDFQGDILAVITMISSALRSGSPLPQISPCPLLDRFMLQYHGLEIIHKESEEDYGLPRILTLETLQDEQYLFFCVGVSTAFRLMTRLDRLMIAAKEIVGEQYHISGLGVGVAFGRTNTKDSDWGARAAVRFSPPQEV